jgi:hypothetical protein
MPGVTMKTIKLCEDQVGDLTIQLNMLLRDRRLAQEFIIRMNDVFKQLTGHDHECMERIPA